MLKKQVKEELLIRNNKESAKEIHAGHLRPIYGSYKKSTEDVEVDIIDSELFCVTHPCCMRISADEDNVALDYYVYSYLFMETLALKQVSVDTVKEVIVSLKATAEDKTSPLFPMLGPFHAKTKYCDRIIEFLEDLIKLKEGKGGDTILMEYLQELKSPELTEALILLGKSVCVNISKHPDDLIDALNAGKPYAKIKRLSGMTSAFRLSVPTFNVDEDCHLISEPSDIDFILGRERPVLHISSDSYLILYDIPMAEEFGYDPDKASSKDSAEYDSDEQHMLLSCKSVREYASALHKMKDDIESAYEHEKVIFEEKITKSTEVVKRLAELLASLGRFAGKLTKPIGDSELKQSVKDLEDQLSQITFPEGVDSEGIEGVITGLKRARVPPPASKVAIPQTKSTAPAEQMQASSQQSGAAVMMMRPEWKVELGECKKCQERKRIVKQFKNCSAKICQGLDRCFACLRDESTLPHYKVSL